MAYSFLNIVTDYGQLTRIVEVDRDRYYVLMKI